MDPATRFVLSRPSPERARQYRTRPEASQPLSSPPVVVSLEGLAVLLASCYLGSRSVTVPCISSGCPRCDTSRTAWNHLCRRLVGGLHKIVRLKCRNSRGFATFLATCILSTRTLDKHASQKIGNTWMLILELAEVINALVNDDPEAVWLVVRRNIAGGESLGHVVRSWKMEL